MKKESYTKVNEDSKIIKSMNATWVEKAKKMTIPDLGINPKSDRVIVLPMEGNRVSAGGIIIPDTAKETPLVGLVVAVGPGRTDDEPMTTWVGEVVLYGKYAGSEYTAPDGVTYLIMRMGDISGDLY